MMLASKTSSPKASASITGGGNQETGGKKPCSDVEEVSEDSDDEDQVLETSQNGRWEKLNVQVSPKTRFTVVIDQTRDYSN